MTHRRKAGSTGLIITRFAVGIYNGILTPANYMVANKWFPTSERNVVLSIFYSGSNFGNILFALAGVVNDYLGWEYLFFIPGSLAILCSLLVLCLFNDEPTTSSFVSEDEKKLLEQNPSPGDCFDIDGKPMKLKKKKRSFSTRSVFHYSGVAVARIARRKPAPWFKMMGNMQFWALLAGVFGKFWAFESTVTYTYIYLTQIHDYSLTKASLLNTIP